MTTIIGVDASTSDKKIGLARGKLGDDGCLTVESARLGSEVASVVDALAEWISEPTLLAMDAPLGWPSALAEHLPQHKAGDAIHEYPNQLFRRETDRFVRRQIKKQSLDVGADRIARTAHSTLKWLDELRQQTKRTIPLAWKVPLEQTAAIEVYPAATLIAHGWEAKGYKKSGEIGFAARLKLVKQLQQEATLPKNAEHLADTDDRLDAALCVLAGADFLRERCFAPSQKQRALAKREGWIWLINPKILRS